jgi:hypothetical protein
VADISSTSYFVEVPEVALWHRNRLRYHDHLHPITDFFEDCRACRLPACSLTMSQSRPGSVLSGQPVPRSREAFHIVASGASWDTRC